jgi:hypothetical protein
MDLKKKFKFISNSQKHFLIIFLPGLFYYFFKVFGPFTVDPGLFFSGLINDDSIKIVGGWPTIEPNAGQSSLVGGYMGFDQILDFKIPYWNYYSGLGTKLLADYQAAVFFPFAWLLYFGNSGQILLHFVLPLIGSFSLYFFLKKINFSTNAALLAALLFQFNSIFIWLQNAIFNPITFFPCLLLSIEIIYEEIKNKDYSIFSKGTLASIIFASLAVLSGFPEIVFLYSFALLGWVIFRIYCLKNKKQNLFFFTKILTFCFLSLLITLPVIYAFLDFLLNEATQERLTGPGYSNHHRNLISLIVYLFPYFFGPIFGYPHPELYKMWGGIGGYCGFLIFFFSTLHVLYLPNIKKTFLYSISIILILIQFGFPVLSSIFYAIPLMKSVAAARYLNIIWIVIFICLAASFLSNLNTKDNYNTIKIFKFTKKLLIRFIYILSILLIVVLAKYNLDIVKYFRFILSSKIYLWSFFSLIFPFSLVFLSFYFIHKKKIIYIYILTFLETFLLAFVPLFSYPINAEYDLRIINFLKNNINHNRIVAAPGGSSPLSANYGGLFGIAQLNYDHVPAPQKTYDYLRDNIDKYTTTSRFLPDFPPQHLDSIDRKLLFFENLEKYGNIGVKYILQSKKNSNRLSINPFGADFTINTLRENKKNIFNYENLIFNKSIYIDRIDLFLGYSGNEENLLVEVCNIYDVCSKGKLDFKDIENNKYNEIKLNNKLLIHKEIILKLYYEEVSNDANLYIFEKKFLESKNPLPILRLGFVDNNIKKVFETEKHEILLIDKFKSYFSAKNCILKVYSREILDSICSEQSTLTRRELYNKNWKAKVNNNEVDIFENEIFQNLKIPSGRSKIKFYFEDKIIEIMINISFFVILMLVIIFFYKIIINNKARDKKKM